MRHGHGAGRCINLGYSVGSKCSRSGDLPVWKSEQKGLKSNLIAVAEIEGWQGSFNWNKYEKKKKRVI